MTLITKAVTLLLVSSVLANARHLETSNTETEDSSGQRSSVQRHRKNRNVNQWGYNYGYNNPPPPPPPIQPNNQYGPPPSPDPWIYNILKDIADIAAYIRRQQNVQPTVVAYPFIVPQYIPHCPATPTTDSPSVTLSDRLPVLDDARMNWGLVNRTSVTTESPNLGNPFAGGDDDDDDEPPRPISFDPVPPPPGFVPATNIFHTSDSSNARAPRPAAATAQTSSVTIRSPTACDLATLSCCHIQNSMAQCFQSTKCRKSPIAENLCSAEAVRQVLARVQSYYDRVWSGK